MIRYIIKNNVKILMRNFIFVIVLTVAPLLMTAILSSGFSSLMAKHKKDITNFEVAYSLGDDKSSPVTEEVMGKMIDFAESSGISFVEINEKDPDKVLEAGTYPAFILFDSEGYKIYQGKDSEVEGKKLEYVLYVAFDKFSDMAVFGGNEGSSDITLDVKNPKFMKEIDATDYYGIIEIVYFGWCSILVGAILLSAEKKNRIVERFYVSGLDTAKVYFSKYIPLGLVTVFCLEIGVVFEHILNGVHFGNLFITTLIIMLLSFASMAFGLMINAIVDNMIATVIILFTIIWTMGYIGGSFETYMFSWVPDKVKHISPIYHTNRALVELSCNGKSDYVVSAVIYMIAISVICSVIAIFVSYLRRKGKR